MASIIKYFNLILQSSTQSGNWTWEADVRMCLIMQPFIQLSIDHTTRRVPRAMGRGSRGLRPQTPSVYWDRSDTATLGGWTRRAVRDTE